MLAAAVWAVTMSVGKPASAEPRMLPAGVVVKGFGERPGSVDLYSFMTLPGDTHTITVRSSSKNPLQIQLLDAGGNVVMEGSGVGEVKMAAVASWSDAYSVAVIRADTSAPYAIQRQTRPGTVQQFMLAHRVGYTNSGSGMRICWIEPGKSVREKSDWYSSELAIEGPRTINRYAYDGREGSTTRTMKLVAEGIAVADVEREEVLKTTLDLKPERFRYNAAYTFSGYRCGS